MLFVALGAVVLGGVLLVISFVTENTAWAWGCIGACGVAAAVLVVDTLRRGRATRRAAKPEAAAPTAAVSGLARPTPDQTPIAEQPTQVLPPAGSGAVAGQPAGAEPGTDEAGDYEPDEEDVDAADALVVGSLSTQVVVVDEHPRFHLASCPWLTDRPTLPLPVSEAMELGFTGCARCTPSAVLAGQSRTR